MRAATIARAAGFLASIAALGACGTGEEVAAETQEPVLLTRDLPFRYPPTLYSAGVEGEVALRLFVDSVGLVVPESTRVEEPSSHVEFDSAAVAGARFLEFMPAQEGGTRQGQSVVLPVKFKLPAKDSSTADTATR